MPNIYITALVLFSDRNPFADQLALPERRLSVAGRDLVIEQDWKPDGKGGTDIGFGASVYDSAVVLCRLLESRPDLVRGRRVLELGTGTGVVAVAAAALGAAEVVATDGDRGVVELAGRNLVANAAEGDGPARAEWLLWGDEAQAAALGAPFDVVLVADCVAVPYAPALVDLAATLAQTVPPSPGGELVLVYKPRVVAAEEPFFEALRAHFVVEEQPEEEAVAEDYRGTGVVVYMCRRLG